MALLEHFNDKVTQNDLFQYITNTGALYPKMCNLARWEKEYNARSPAQWLALALLGASMYEKEFGNREQLFNSANIFAVALDLTEYYHQHIKE